MIKRKGASLAFTATLLASLLATIAAPAVLGAVTVTSAGTVPRGGTSASTAAFSFTENAAACFTSTSPGAVAPDPLPLPAGNELQIAIYDADDAGFPVGPPPPPPGFVAGPADVSFSGTPVVTAPGSLGTVTATVSGNVLNINWTNSDDFNIEQLTVSGLTITAASAATPGAIRATIAGNAWLCVQPGGTATGTLAAGIGVGATSVVVNVTSGSCTFVTTPPGGNLAFATSPESVAVSVATALGVPAAGQQTLTIAATTSVHNAGEAVSQSTACASTGLLASPGTVANAVTQTVGSPAPQVIPGENNQPVQNVIVSEDAVPPAPAAASNVFASGQTVTFAISNPASGVLFSNAPTATPSATLNLGSGLGMPVTCNVAFDRRSCTVSITGASNVTSESITLGDYLPGGAPAILVDVASTAPLGTPVRITASISPAVAVNVTGSLVANVGRVVVGVAAQPAIYIGENDQVSGQITLTESGANFFTAGSGSNNTFGLCLATGETFTRAPWAVVTAAGGTPGLQLLSGVVGASQVQGTLFNGGTCARWTVFSASTTGPATIEIRGSADGTTPLASGANNGPRLSVPAGLQPGTTQSVILIGQQASVAAGCGATPFVPSACAAVNAAFSSVVSNAVRAFRSGVVVAAASRPLIERGDTDALAGNITITETANGQFKPGQVITVQVLARATTLRQDVLLNTANTNNQPIITTNSASGLLTSPVAFFPAPVISCQNAIPLVAICAFNIVISQQSFGPTLGQITISNIKYFVLPDAVLGPVQVQVSSSGLTGGPTNGVAFQEVVSNAVVGTAAVRTSINNTSAIGVTTTAAFTASTKLVDAGDYITWRATMSPSMSGERVVVWIARKAANGTWGAFTRFTTRAVNAQGLAYFHYDNGDNPGWISVKFSFLGNNQHAAGSSLARQGRYL